MNKAPFDFPNLQFILLALRDENMSLLDAETAIHALLRSMVPEKIDFREHHQRESSYSGCPRCCEILGFNAAIDDMTRRMGELK